MVLHHSTKGAFMKVVYIVKNKLDAEYSVTTKGNFNKAEASLNEDKEEIYSTRDIDGAFLYECWEKNQKEGIIMLVSYKKDGRINLKVKEETEINCIHIGEANLCCNETGDRKCDIKFRIKKKIEDKSVIINLLDGIELSVSDDFEKMSYVMINYSSLMVKSLIDLMVVPIIPKLKSGYAESGNQYKLEDYAQHNRMCRRMYGVLGKDEGRNEFQRDRERIVNSRAFRRLVDKAQIFSAEKGDHYRTRMTHTLEVNQIAKAISSSLRLNLDLTEAIALAHDLGHTPFGHQGERTLNSILSGEELEGLFHIEDSVFTKTLMGGFKHNYQSVRVLTKLEEKYVEHLGLNVSIQVLEGVLKHTKLKDAEIKEFIDPDFETELYLEQDFSVTLEGQVVAIADEIAQRGHDIDDAITSGLITVDELLDSLNTNKFQKLSECLCEERDNINENKRSYIDEKELIIGRFISCIVGFFIRDVIKNSIKKIDINKVSAKGNFEEIFTEKIIDFSDKEKVSCKFLEKIVNKRVITNSEVACFDYNASVIIRKLFEAYYKNPKLLHCGTLRKIYIDTIQHEDKMVSNKAVDLLNGNLDIVREEIKSITTYNISDIGKDEENIIFEKRKILVRNIVDYIAGMTDSYAVKEYEKIK